MDQIDLKRTLKFAEDLSIKVGKFLLGSRDRVKVEEYKDEVDICTNIDLQAEEIFIRAIERKFPDHNILSEERGVVDKKSAYTWIMDPLDGTKEYIRKIPLYTTCLILEKAKEPILSVVFHPATKELHSSAKGIGYFLNREKKEVSQKKELKKSYVYFHPPSFRSEIQSAEFAWKKISEIAKKAYRVRGFVYDNLILSWLASERIDSYIYFGTPKSYWYDHGPGLFLVLEAGGKVTDLQGEKIRNQNISNGIVATNGSEIHQELLEIINDSK